MLTAEYRQTQEVENQYIPSEFSQRKFPASPQRSPQDPQPVGTGSDIASDDDDDTQFLGTQPRESHKGKGRRISISSESADDVDESPGSDIPGTDITGDAFRDIDNISLDPLTAPPLPPLISMEGRSQHLSLSQLPSQYRNPTSSAATGTRGARGEERKKSKKLESQQRQSMKAAAEKSARAASRAAAAERKEAKKMAPRKEDVSQLAEQLMSSSL